jgi:hypothetical protein
VGFFGGAGGGWMRCMRRSKARSLADITLPPRAHVCWPDASRRRSRKESHAAFARVKFRQEVPMRGPFSLLIIRR